MGEKLCSVRVFITMPPVSIVTTVLNDLAGTEVFLDRMAAQTFLPKEVVIVDGGSKDGTWEFLQERSDSQQPWQLLIRQELGCNVARGRNLAIKCAAYDLIASSDIGCDWDPQWLEELVAPFVTHRSVEVVVGSWAVPKEWARTKWAKTEYAFRSSMKLEAIPSSQAVSRSIAYRKSAWERVGGYPEDLTLAADDTCFDFLLKKYQLVSAAAPRIRCYWHRHSRLKGFLSEEYRNFYGDGEAAFRNKHFLLVGGRLAVEVVGAAAVAFELVYQHWCLGCTFLALGMVVSILLRLERLRGSARKLAAEHVDHPWGRLVAFEYLTKLWGLFGYLRGYLNGFRRCRKIRQRLSA